MFTCTLPLHISLGPFSSSDKVVYLHKFSFITNILQHFGEADKSSEAPPTKVVPGKNFGKID